jgi:D-sedoheptulose 7-phosphate isomerase
MVTPIKLLALDIDGVITDGRASFSPAGEEAKTFSFHDLDAVTLWQRQGLRVALITGEEGAMVETIARRFGVETVISGAKDKLAAVQTLATAQQVHLNEIAYVGDGDRDAPALAAVGLGLAPANATPAARASAHRQLTRLGGNGAVAEAVRLIQALETPGGGALMPDIMQIMQASLEAHQRLIKGKTPLVLGDIAQAFIIALRAGHKLIFFGNVSSAADAQHVAAEFVGRFFHERRPLPALALTADASVLKAISTDWSFEDVFARQVQAFVHPGDVVIGISTGGSSPSVLRGLEAGREGGAVTIGFTGQRGGKMTSYCDLCFRAPSPHTPRIQELHILAWHAICEIVEVHLMESA